MEQLAIWRIYVDQFKYGTLWDWITRAIACRLLQHLQVLNARQIVEAAQAE